jgi:hypothetical protein
VNTNELIQGAVLAAMSGQWTPEPEPGYCLKTVRQTVETALGWESGEFYARYRTHVVEENDTGVPWARDLQRSLRLAGYGVPYEGRQPGDLLFTHKLAPQGHTGVLLSRWHMLENTNSSRGVFVSGANRVSYLPEFPVLPEHVEIFRLPSEL